MGGKTYFKNLYQPQTYECQCSFHKEITLVIAVSNKQIHNKLDLYIFWSIMSVLNAELNAKMLQCSGQCPGCYYTVARLFCVVARWSLPDSSQRCPHSSLYDALFCRYDSNLSFVVSLWDCFAHFLVTAHLLSISRMI